MQRQLDIVYFAWVKERLGRSEDTVQLPDTVKTIADFLQFMGTSDAIFLELTAEVHKLRFALDQDFAKPETELVEAKELAIFPPVTGG